MANSALLPRATPESQGVDPSAIERLARAFDAEGLGLHSLMVVRHGHVIGEGWWHPYSAARRHIMFSVSKSFSATAIGIARDEGLLSLDETILDFFPAYATERTRENMDGVALRHLLSMSTGHEVDTMAVMREHPQDDWVRLFLDTPITRRPGEHFLYNSGASFMLSAIITARTGQKLVDYLTPRLFEPLGIEGAPWQENARGINLGASGLRITTEELAAFGQLYLQRGMWNGQRLFSDDWGDQATRWQVQTGTAGDDGDWNQGYGFQFWRSRHDSFRADGAYGQFSLVVPSHDLVVAITAGTSHNTEIPDVVWRELLPSIEEQPRRPDPEKRESLSASLASLAVSAPAPAAAESDPPLARGAHGRTIRFAANTLGISSATVLVGDAEIGVRITRDSSPPETIRAGRSEWLFGQSTLWPYEEMDVVVTAGRASWTDERTLEVLEQCVETPFRRIWTIRFADAREIELSARLDNGFWENRIEHARGAFGEAESHPAV